MLAVDTSAFIAFMENPAAASERLEMALADGTLTLPPVVVAELLSAPLLDDKSREWIADLPMLETKSGFWHRVGAARCTLLSQKLKSKLGDAMIAQSCIDHDIALLTNDTDFRHYAQHLGLKLL